MNILWLVSGEITQQGQTYTSPIASVRLRLLNYLPYFSAEKYNLNMAPLDSTLQIDRLLNGCDAVVFGKVLTPGCEALSKAIRARNIPLILDICDDIFNYEHLIARYQPLLPFATHLIASTPYLHRALQERVDVPCFLVPDCTEGERIPPQLRQGMQDKPRLLWFGMPNNMNALTPWMDVLNRMDKPMALKVVSQINESIDNWVSHYRSRYPQISIETVNWSLPAMEASLKWCDMVLIPAVAQNWGYAKTANRVQTALWAGKPCIAENVPAYEEFAPYIFLNQSPDTAINSFCKAPDATLEKVEAAQVYLAQQATAEKIWPKWNQLFERLQQPKNENPVSVLWFVSQIGRNEQGLFSNDTTVQNRYLTPAVDLIKAHRQVSIQFCELKEGAQLDASLFQNVDLAIVGQVFLDWQVLYQHLASLRIPMLVDLPEDPANPDIAARYASLFARAEQLVVSSSEHALEAVPAHLARGARTIPTDHNLAKAWYETIKGLLNTQ